MSKLQLQVNPGYTLDVTARESDEYTQSVYLKFEHNMSPEDISGTYEMFMTPKQLELLAGFLLRKAVEIKTDQLHREV